MEGRARRLPPAASYSAHDAAQATIARQRRSDKRRGRLPKFIAAPSLEAQRRGAYNKRRPATARSDKPSSELVSWGLDGENKLDRRRCRIRAKLTENISGTALDKPTIPAQGHTAKTGYETRRFPSAASADAR